MALDGSGYSGLVFEKISLSGSKVGEIIRVSEGGQEYKGVLMPRSHNIGVKLTPDSKVTRIGPVKRPKRPEPSAGGEPKGGLPTVSILSTGGTIASKVDYQTGAVNPALSAQDFYDLVPELQERANVQAKVVLSLLSEDIVPSDWIKIAKAVAAEVKKGVDGVVIAHGTDTLGYTAAALSFALQDLPVPVILVGSQRSSDRPSSDAALNLVGATDLAGKADAAEVMVVMHGTTEDSYLLAHRGTRVRKSHTSRRDAFQSVNSHPLFRIDQAGITELSKPLFRRNPSRKLRVKAGFDDRVALVMTYPGIAGGVIDHLVDTGYRGIVLAGTGLGHAPTYLQPSVQRAVENGLVVVMTSQCIAGRTDMNVYRSGVELLEIGVVPCEDMLPETALVKLMWTLANSKDGEEAKAIMTTSLVGEIDMRSEPSEYHPRTEVT
jgi:glutamyl-tRNA(Gln) amidotransferase subunit D